MNRVIYRISTTETDDGFVPADYADLDTRHLGTIYEGLLERTGTAGDDVHGVLILARLNDTGVVELSPSVTGLYRFRTNLSARIADDSDTNADRSRTRWSQVNPTMSLALATSQTFSFHLLHAITRLLRRRRGIRRST